MGLRVLSSPPFYGSRHCRHGAEMSPGANREVKQNPLLQSPHSPTGFPLLMLNLNTPECALGARQHAAALHKPSLPDIQSHLSPSAQDRSHGAGVWSAPGTLKLRASVKMERAALHVPLAGWGSVTSRHIPTHLKSDTIWGD